MISFLPSRAVVISIGSFEVHWYGLLYLLSFVLALLLLPLLQRERSMRLTRDDWLGIVSWAAFGVIIGGRLGYVLFYEPGYFSRHPLKVFALWEGGMSSHGGFVGVALALTAAGFLWKINLRKLADLAVVPAAIGLMLGRIGNFINQELYGTVTDLPWGMFFPGAEGLRHPLQLYDAALSLLIAGICFLHLKLVSRNPGQTCALFLLLYTVERFSLEFIRAQQYPLVQVFGFDLTRGQLLTLPLLPLAVLLFIWFTPEETE